MRQTRPSHTTRASSLPQRTRFRRYKQYDFSKVSSGFSLHSGRASAYCTKPWTVVSTQWRNNMQRTARKGKATHVSLIEEAHNLASQRVLVIRQLGEDCASSQPWLCSQPQAAPSAPIQHREQHVLRSAALAALRYSSFTMNWFRSANMRAITLACGVLDPEPAPAPAPAPAPDRAFFDMVGDATRGCSSLLTLWKAHTNPSRNLPRWRRVAAGLDDG